MKRRFIKIALAILIPVLLIGGGVSAYLALTADIQVTTQEALTWVSAHEFEVKLMPGETTEVVMEIHNASTAALPVQLTKSINPFISGLTIVCPDSFTAPANDNIRFNVVITALPSVEVGSTRILIEFDR